MTNLIIGTAGHIDHGKTTLIKALTGINADRLREEQERGITIDIGFAHMTLPSGRRVGIVDVPGHEKFVKNMLAGVSGIEIALLVIAADEGIMPQTKEHLNILNILDIKKGITVITKADLVDDEWLELVTEDIKQHIKGTFLENFPVIPVSSTTGEGLDRLRMAIDEICNYDIKKDLESPFRLPVDRIFSLQGIGTVVTGSLLCGKVKTGQDIQIFPKGIKSRVRSLEVHDKSVDEAEAGQRTALNIVDVKTDDIHRGDVIAPYGTLLSVSKVYVYLKLMEDAPWPLKNRARVRVHVGTKEVLARMVLFDRQKLNPGEDCFAELLFEESVACAYKDHFVIRSYSPIISIGGGQIIYPNPRRLKKAEKQRSIDILNKALHGDMEQFTYGLLKTFGKGYMFLKDVCPYVGKNIDQVKKTIRNLYDKNKVVLLNINGEDLVLNKKYGDNLKDKAIAIVESYHKNYPISDGISKEELRSKLNLEQRLFEGLMEKWIEQDLFEVSKNTVKRLGFEVVLDDMHLEIKNKIMEVYNTNMWSPPSTKDLISMFPENQRNQATDILYRLLAEGMLTKLNDEIFVSKASIQKAIKKLQNYFLENNELTVSEFRDMLKTTRKYAVPILEHLDSMKITKRIGEKRSAGSNLYL
jgi:selenocysteine-specific elongation factor